MEKNNIFENAYFGKAYKTMDGSKAIFHGIFGNENLVMLFVEGKRKHIKCTINGKSTYTDGVVGSNWADIVSEWQEVNEDELRNETEEYAENMMIIHCKEHHIDCPNHIIKDALRRAYEDGRRKEKEDKQ